MKKLLIAALLAISFAAPATAAFEWTYKNYFTLAMPLARFDIVHLYDFNGKENLLGGETPVIKFPWRKELSVTIGGVGDLSSPGDSALNQDDRELLRGTPFFGVKYDIPNLTFAERIGVGIFYGRNLNEGDDIYGVKSSYKFWGE